VKALMPYWQETTAFQLIGCVCPEKGAKQRCDVNALYDIAPNFWFSFEKMH